MRSLASSRFNTRALESEIATIDRPAVVEAREALRFWRDRAARLPWYRWEARREARVMASRWRERLLRARLERWGLRALAPALLPVARGSDDLGRRVAGRLLRPQGLVRRAVLFTAVTAVAAVATFVLLVVLAVEIAGRIV